MYPELFRIGNFPIHAYGLLLALALLVGLSLAARLAAREGIKPERIYDLGLWMLVGAIGGSKLLMVLTEPIYRESFWQLFSLDFLRSGGVFYGGLIGAFLMVSLGVLRYRLPWWKTGDAAMTGVALGQAIGRVGCFAAGCCWGKPTELPWGVQFTAQAQQNTGVPIDMHLHPTQLYESFGALAIFALLYWLHRRKRFDGQVMLAYIALYSLLRFAVEFVRDDPRGDVLGLTSLTGLSTSQLISLLVGVIGFVALLIRWRNHGPASLAPLSPTP